MGINPIIATSYSYPIAGINRIGQPVNAVNKVNEVNSVASKRASSILQVKPSECQTCKSRKYIDGSNDSNVSFQTPTHISTSASFSAVSAHEKEHVSNAVIEGSKEGHKLLSASVTLEMAVCPECGTPYVEGGTTQTAIVYNSNNPYENARKSLEGSLLLGMNFDSVA